MSKQAGEIALKAKKISTMLFVLALTLTFYTGLAFAQNGYTLKINGQVVELDPNMPIITYNDPDAWRTEGNINRALLPAKFVLAKLGATINEDKNGNITVAFPQDEIIITTKINAETGTYNGNFVKMNIAFPQKYKNMIYMLPSSLNQLNSKINMQWEQENTLNIKTNTPQYKDYKILYMNDREIKFDGKAKPLRAWGSVYVPVIPFAKQLGGEVMWDDKKGYIAILYEGHKIEIKYGEPFIISAGDAIYYNRSKVYVDGKELYQQEGVKKLHGTIYMRLWDFFYLFEEFQGEGYYDLKEETKTILKCYSKDYVNAIKVTINDKPLISDVLPVTLNNRTMVPLRAIFEALGATVEWDAQTQTITGIKGDNKIILQINNRKAKVNSQEIELDAPATIVKQRTMVPARFIAESLGAKVDWVPENNIVRIKVE